MRNDLTNLFQQLCIEFGNINNIASYGRIMSAFKVRNVFDIGVMRGDKSKSFKTIPLVDNRVLQILVGGEIRHLPITEKIYEFFSHNDLWHTKYKDFKECCGITPSLITQVIAGFLVRNFELNGYRLITTDYSFDIAMSEMVDYLQADTINVNTFITLYGIHSDIEEIQIGENVSIVRANSELVRQFSINNIGDHGAIVYEEDCLIKVEFKFNKSDFSFKKTQETPWRIIDKEVEKLRRLPVLTLPTDIRTGEYLNTSAHWQAVTPGVWGPMSEGRYYDSFKELEKISEEDITMMKSTYLLLKTIDFKTLDDNIKYSFQRLERAKANYDINDKVIELALAYEYLINTTNSDVGLQLKLKLIKLLSNSNTDESLYAVLGKFYSLRSNVVHGSKRLVSTPENSEIITRVSTLIQKALVKFMRLNQDYSYKEIDCALVKAMHIVKPLEILLNESKIKTSIS